MGNQFFCLSLKIILKNGYQKKGMTTWNCVTFRDTETAQITRYFLSNLLNENVMMLLEGTAVS